MHGDLSAVVLRFDWEGTIRTFVPGAELATQVFAEVRPSLCLLCNSALHYSAFWNTARTAFVLTLVLFYASR